MKVVKVDHLLTADRADRVVKVTANQVVKVTANQVVKVTADRVVKVGNTIWSKLTHLVDIQYVTSTPKILSL